MSTLELELQRFTEYVKGHDDASLSLDELFSQWRAEHPTPDNHDENVAAVQAAIDDFKSGDRGTPAGEHSAQLRREYGLEAS